MGTFRLVLAVAVLLAHVQTALGHSIVNRESLHILVWSGEAVFAFFVISGFYMSLIVDDRYSRLPRGTLRFSRIDNYLGQLSYPVYLAHMLVIGWVARLALPPWLDKGLVALAATLALSMALYGLVDRPIERLRRRVGAA